MREEEMDVIGMMIIGTSRYRSLLLSLSLPLLLLLLLYCLRCVDNSTISSSSKIREEEERQSSS